MPTNLHVQGEKERIENCSPMQLNSRKFCTGKQRSFPLIHQSSMAICAGGSISTDKNLKQTPDIRKISRGNIQLGLNFVKLFNPLCPDGTSKSHMRRCDIKFI